MELLANQSQIVVYAAQFFTESVYLTGQLFLRIESSFQRALANMDFGPF